MTRESAAVRGQRIDKRQLLGLLPASGRSDIYRGRTGGTDRAVADKTLCARADLDAVARFRNEAALARQPGHPDSASIKHVGQVDPRHALGAVLYETLTGRPPHPGDASYAASRAPGERIAPPSALNAPLAPHLDAVVLRALERDPQRRFSSGEHFRAARQRIGNLPRREWRRFTW